MKITIEAPARRGKTTTAILIKDMLEKLGAKVKVYDFDFPNTVPPIETRGILTKLFNGQEIEIETKQLARSTGLKPVKTNIPSITVPLEENFRACWRWVAETGFQKEDWPGFDTIRNLRVKGLIINQNLTSILRHSCFACDNSSHKCDTCPIEWKNSYGTIMDNCEDNDSLYSKYLDSKYLNASDEEDYITDGIKITKQIANEISELPWKNRK